MCFTETCFYLVTFWSILQQTPRKKGISEIKENEMSRSETDEDNYPDVILKEYRPEQR